MKLINLLLLSIILSVGQWFVYAGSALGFDQEYLSMELTGIIGETYDDNVTYAQSGLIDDFITYTGLGVDIDYLEKRRDWKMSGNIVQHSFADRSNFDNTSVDMKAAFSNEISKFIRLKMSNDFYYGEQPRSFEDGFGRSDGRYSFYINKFDINYENDVSKQVTLKYRYFNELYDVTRQDLRDSTLNGIGIESEYFLSSKLLLNAFYSFELRSYDPGNNVQKHTLGCGGRYFFTHQLRSEVKLGYDLIDNNETQYNTTEPFMDLALINELDEITSMRLGLNQSSYASEYSQDIFDKWQISFGVMRQVFARLKTDISAFYGDGEYVTTNIDEKLKGLKLGLIYDISTKMKGNIYYSYSEVNSIDITREYTRNAVSLGITAIF